MVHTRKSRLWLTSVFIGCVIIVVVIAAAAIIPKLTAKGCHANPAGSSVCDGCEIPSTIPVDTYPGKSNSKWSPDCEYFAATDLHGSSLNPYYHWNVFETTTWKRVCEVGEGDVMLGLGIVGGYCELPLSNGQTWVVVGGSLDARHVRFIVCQDPKSCISPDDIPPIIR